MNDWRVLDPEQLVLEVAGLLLTAAVERPGQKVWLQQELERRGISRSTATDHRLKWAACRLFEEEA